jgi:hypothetical protein
MLYYDQYEVRSWSDAIFLQLCFRITCTGRKLSIQEDSEALELRVTPNVWSVLIRPMLLDENINILVTWKI